MHKTSQGASINTPIYFQCGPQHVCEADIRKSAACRTLKGKETQGKMMNSKTEHQIKDEIK